jgi:hypothetical protein
MLDDLTLESRGSPLMRVYSFVRSLCIKGNVVRMLDDLILKSRGFPFMLSTTSREGLA